MALFSSSGWRDRLRDASFRGVPFSVDDDDASFGRRVQLHEYPKRDKPYTEDLGRAARRLTINAYVIGDDYADKRDRLIAAVETEGPGTLVHPQYGEMQGSINGTVKVSHSSSEGRMSRISFEFVESGELTFPVAGVATAQQLGQSGGLFDDAIDSMFSAFGLSGVADFIQNDVIADATAMINTVADAFKMVDSGVSAAMRLLQGDLSVILMPPSTTNDFIRALQKAWRAGDRLSGDTSDLVTMIKTMSGITLDPGLSPRGTWPTDSGSVVIQRTQSNLVASAIRSTAISTATSTVTTLAQPRNVPSQTPGAGGESDIINITHPALDGAQSVSPGNAPPNWEDLNDIRAALNAAIDQEQLRIRDDYLFQKISVMRADLNHDISARLAQVERTAQRTPDDVLPALVLAALWYDDAGRESDILNRNTVRHPGFVPVGPLRVPVR
ncbi:DNA circularization N-terminal domain-containing protein [Citrobacter freundii]|uniref:DNA circularization protein n=1 Tax=Citrobacter freundii TaxID=546 RepID=UPI0008FD810B|nr:DNA circularization N-terminal domain-containing protein [Citrobacter freundii]EJG2197913.1 DNA circularization N-terminal domain-containing protein [Citrobacter freundii]EKA7901628.1 DNA circularization N-terminal domain-containing protein [Citrobacter freundii]EMA2417203.1 DNA circularization N-terminal domain-containing protein [Citrobacter freundii]MBA8414719.1 DNA circularization N-terminal domain-containing protein [Citrobacter freundii]MEB2375874.1 DNA circularization N-terminal doma